MQIIKTNTIPNLRENDVLVVLNNDSYIFFDEGNAGIDLSAVEDTKPEGLATLVKVKTGIKTVIPDGLVGKIYPRSSTYQKTGMLLVNGVGIIDPSYRGEIICPFVIFDSKIFNNTFKNRVIPKHTRIAQLIIEPISQSVGNIFILQDNDVYENIGNIFPTKRGSKGFGSTGLF